MLPAAAVRDRQARGLVGWIAASGKNLTTVYITPRPWRSVVRPRCRPGALSHARRGLPSVVDSVRRNSAPDQFAATDFDRIADDTSTAQQVGAEVGGEPRDRGQHGAGPARCIMTVACVASAAAGWLSWPAAVSCVLAGPVLEASMEMA